MVENTNSQSCPVEHRMKEHGECPVKGSVDGGGKENPSAWHNIYASVFKRSSRNLAASPDQYNAAANDLSFNQSPQPDQKASLSTKRAVSGIEKSDFTPAHQPKGMEKWVYPSEQQYFNAMKRKGYDPQEQDVPVILAIHNLVNERGWSQIKIWEALHGSYNPKLKRFVGRPNDLSPKARILSLFGYSLPFDRHDWIVERENGTEARYVIDFYQGAQQKKDNNSSISALDSSTRISEMQPAPIAIHLDVRPALDSFSALVDRINYFVRENFKPESLPKPQDAPRDSSN